MATQAVTGPESTARRRNGEYNALANIDAAETPMFMAAQPKEKGYILSSMWKHGLPILTIANFSSDLFQQTGQLKPLLWMLTILWSSYPVLKLIGFVFEWIINFFVLNHGPFSLLFKLLFFQWHDIVIPRCRSSLPLARLDAVTASTYKALQPKKSTIVNFPSFFFQRTWQQNVSAAVVTILWRSYPVLKLIGFVFEWIINFFVLNHGPFSLLFKLFFFQWHHIVIPKPHADNYLSCVGQLDPRSKLLVDTSKKGKAESTRADAKVFPDENIGSRRTADVCVMAAKLSYENPAVVERVVEKDWKMHFVKFYNCWNEYQKMHNTQAFICMDKRTDANAVVVAFRGTEAFNAYDWSTDLDFSWVKLDRLGGVHLGFLEALGMVTREDVSSLTIMCGRADKAHRKANKANWMRPNQEQQEYAAQDLPSSQHRESLEEIEQTSSGSGLKNDIIQDGNKSLAYDDITREVKLLLRENPKAKLFITGHSLGGALASLYAVMLRYMEQTEITDKIGAVYTFGQPRVGDSDVRTYANENLAGKFFRVVYCNDLVPRVPFDNEIMAFKHFGRCAYFNSVYDGLHLEEAPNPNFFGVARLITMHFNALWEVFHSILISRRHGQEYSESAMSFLFRTMGLMLPGVASHSPTNYVNSVRLGPFPLRERVKGDVADISQEIRLVQDNVKDIVSAVFEVFLQEKDN